MMNAKKLVSLLLALCMLLGMMSVGYADALWTEETTADGWMKVINQDGATLGYSANSGVKLIEADGYAFKDLNQNGALDTYEDWRVDYETRARALADTMTGEEIAPYLTHGGWGTFTTTAINEDNSAHAYITAGGRGGVTRNSGSDTAANVDHAIWANLVQELSEGTFHGIPSLISIDPNGQSGISQTLSLASAMDADVALEVGKAYSKQYRAMGINMMLGPQIDLMTSPVMDRGTGTYGEDPALSRDIAEAFVSGMQSTWDGNTDLGWGSDSVMNVMKHYVGAGASEGGRDDHNEIARYSVFPNNNFEAHLIPFHDGAFSLSHSSTGSAGSIMTNYSVSYSKDGSLGDWVAGAYSAFKFDTLKAANWDGLVISDWGVWNDGSKIWGMEEYTVAERVAISIMLGMCQTGGFGDLDVMQEAWELIEEELGEDDGTKLMQDRAYTNIVSTMRLGLFENPYVSTEHVRETNCTVESLAFGLETQLKSLVMLKNDGTVKAAEEGMKTVYIPYNFTAAVIGGWSSSPASCDPAVDLEIAAKYFNVVTDTVNEPSGKDADGNAAYVAEDIVRAAAADIATCDMILVAMDAPHTPSTKIVDESGNETWLPASIQYAEYTATTAKEQSVAGLTIVEQFNDGYTVQTVEKTENRSYKNNTAPQDANYSHLETLLYCVENKGDAKIVVFMNQNGSGSMVWTEVEPLADVILNGYSVKDEVYLKVLAGEFEPSGLLVAQMPASMEAVEAQTGEDTPRDLECYVDANGNTYDFTFGLNWAGVINDARVETYSAAPLTEVTSFDFQYAK